MKKSIPFHPFLFCIYPVLFQYSHNIHELVLPVVFKPAAVILVLTTGLFFALRAVYRDSSKAAAGLSLILIIFFSYGHVHAMLLRVAAVRQMIFFPLCVLLMGAGLYMLKRTRSDIVAATSFLNVAALALVVMICGNIAWIHTKTGKTWFSQNTKVLDAPVKIPKSFKPGNKPDIYLLVFDRYASVQSLKNNFGFDNSAFTGFLRENGFYVADNAVCNYPKTILSMVSMLNMTTLDYIGKRDRNRNAHMGQLGYLVEYSRVQELMHRNGYSYIHLGSSYPPLRKCRTARVNRNFGLYNYLDGFTINLLRTTMLQLAYDRFFEGSQDENRERILQKFRLIRDAAGSDSPKFVLAHVISPHPPYVFNKDGGPANQSLNEREQYLHQLEFTNKKIQEAVKTILRESRREPVIVIASDEGPIMKEFGDFVKTTNPRARCGAFLAMRLPGVSPEDVPALKPDMSPVNIFRIISNVYFKTDYEYLPDKCYRAKSYEYIFEFEDITPQ